MLNGLHDGDSLSRTADNSTFLAYCAHATVTYTKASRVRQTDAVEVLLNKEYKVIDPEGLIR